MLLLFSPTHPKAFNFPSSLCVFSFKFFISPFAISCSSWSQPLCLYLSHLLSCLKPCYASRLNVLSLFSEGLVVRAKLKARECSTQSRAYSSVSQQPSTQLRYWLANGTDQCSLFAIISWLHLPSTAQANSATLMLPPAMPPCLCACMDAWSFCVKRVN